jgi:hypothetical protein
MHSLGDSAAVLNGGLLLSLASKGLLTESSSLALFGNAG